MMMSAPGAEQLLLSTSCLPSPLSACVDGNIGKHLELCSPGEAVHSGKCQQRGLLSPDPLTRPYKDRALSAPSSKGNQRVQTDRVKIETGRAAMKWLKNDRRE